MKKFLLLFIFIAAFIFSGKAQSMNCSDFCVLNINNVDTVNDVLDVTIYHGGTSFMNYPIVVVVNSTGDTIANINNLFFYFGHMPGDTLVHTIPTTADSIPSGFTGTVYYTDPMDSTTCSYAYPMPCTVGINEATLAEGFSVYPNPASHLINISISGNTPTSRINLYDITGKMVRAISSQEKNLSIERGNLPGGVYFIQIVADGVFVKKIILE